MEAVQETHKKTKIGRIPKDWEVLRADELCFKVTDGTHDSPKRVDKGYNLVTSKNLKNGMIDLSTCYNISEKDFIDINKRSYVDQYDVLFGMIGTIGNPVMVTRSIINFAVKNVAIFKTNRDKKLGIWLCHFFNSFFVKNYIERNKNSSTQSFVALGFLRAFPIINPPNDERNKIAEILSTVDEQILLTDKIIEKSKELKKGLMQKLFSEGIGHTEFKDTKIGRIPKDWEVVILNDLLSLLTDFEANGSFASVKENVRISERIDYAWYVRATDLENKSTFDKVKYVNESSYSFLKKTKLKGNEVLITKRGEIGKVYHFIKPIEMPCTLAPNLYLLKINDKVLSKYLYYYFKNNEGNKLLKRINGSTTIGALYKNDVKKIKVKLPPFPEQQKIADILSEADSKIEKEEIKKKKLEELKSGLMQQLLTGKKRVKV